MKFIVKLGTIFILLPAKVVLNDMSVGVNPRMNIHQKGKSVCEHSISHYKNVCKSGSFPIHILEKLEGDGFINGQWDFTVKKLFLEREDIGWTNCAPYGLNERVKSSNLEQPTGKMFLPFPGFSNRCDYLL